MFEGLFIGAAGMRAQQKNVDTIANNLANANTNGFKKGRVSFSEMMVQETNVAMTAGNQDVDAAGVLAAVRHTSVGVSVANIGKIFESGELKKTDSVMDFAIKGDGFFEVSGPDGSTQYSRGGTLTVNKDGLLALQSGQVLKPTISIPDNVQSISIASDGTVQLRIAGQTGSVEAGRVELVKFMNPGHLQALGEGIYQASEKSGQPISSMPGENGLGTVAQGFLEASNVKMLDEMVNLMIAQRAYEANVKIVQAADEMLGMVNNLRR